jgi:hypothetical protein
MIKFIKIQSCAVCPYLKVDSMNGDYFCNISHAFIGEWKSELNKIPEDCPLENYDK